MTRLKTPAGNPTSSKISTSTKALSGVTSLGLATIEQPAAIAGAALAPSWLRGKFQGVIAPTTPIGSRTTSEFPISCSHSISLATWAIAPNCIVGRPA